jgi:hypothetical protein
MRECVNLSIEFEKFIDIRVTHKRLGVETPNIDTFINTRKYSNGRGMVE